MSSVYSVSYQVENLFEQTSQIMDLQNFNDELTFVTRTDDKLLLYAIKLNENNEVQLKNSVSWNDNKEHAIKYSYDHKKGIYYLITALGNIYKIAVNDNKPNLLTYEKEAGFNIPYAMTLIDSQLVVSDIGSRTVKLYYGESFKNIANMKKNEDFFTDHALYYSLSSAGQDEVALVSGYDAYLLNVKTEALTPINTNISFTTEKYISIILTWLSGLVLVLIGIGLVIFLAIYYYKIAGFTDFTYNFMVIIIVIAISVLVIAKYTEDIYSTYQKNSINKILSIGNLLAKNIQAEDVKSIDSMEDYNSQSYKNIVNFLNNNSNYSDEDLLIRNFGNQGF